MIRKSGHRFSGRPCSNKVKMRHYRGSICDNGPGLQRVDSGFEASGLMGKITGFLEIDRHDRKYAPVAERVKSYREFVVPLSEKDTRDQAARCMDCGIPYCHGTWPCHCPDHACSAGSNHAPRRLIVGRPVCGGGPLEPPRARGEVAPGHCQIPRAPDWAPRSRAVGERHPRYRDRARCDS